MKLIEKLYTLLIFAAVLLGLGIGRIHLISANAGYVIVPLLISMLYLTFIQIPLEQLKTAFKDLKFTYTSVFINFVWTPILAWLLAFVFLSDQPALFIGFIMLMVTPCTDWYLIFTGMAKGNVAVSTAILPLNLLLQVILLPIYLLLFRGTTGVIEPKFLAESVLLVFVVPFVLAFLTQQVWKKKSVGQRLLSRLSTWPILFLSLAIMAMFASQGHLLFANLDVLWQITVPFLLFFLINFFVSQKAGRLMRFPASDRISLSFTTLARNSPIALAIAMTAFPNEPLIALTLVIGPLLELPLLAIITQVLKGISFKASTEKT